MTIALDALNRAIDALPGGRPVVAVRLSKTLEVLRKELSPASSHKMGADDAIAIARMCVEANS
ncbi:MAG: transcriptional regulator, partial [Alcaligenaceae bacterium]